MELTGNIHQRLTNTRMLSIAKHGSTPGFIGQKSGVTTSWSGKNSHAFGDPRASGSAESRLPAVVTTPMPAMPR